jgi:putative lipoprotein
MKSGSSPPEIARLSISKAPDKWIGKDKARHFVASFLMTGAVSYSANHHWKCGRPESVQWGFGMTLTLGTLKEIRDIRHPGAQASLKDLAADFLGAACGALLLSGW